MGSRTGSKHAHIRAQVAEEAFATLSERYGYAPPLPIRVEVFPRHADFSVRTLGLDLADPHRKAGKESSIESGLPNPDKSFLHSLVRAPFHMEGAW